MHFYIEHNYGHHQHAATPEDPATAKYNQPVYLFWVSSVLGQLRSAFKLQKNLIRNRRGLQALWHNDLLWYALAQGLYLLLVALFFGANALLWGVLVAVVAVLLLETTNYIEHYGLMRPKKPSGRYAPVKEIHSWNSNHLMGRILLYELTRHSDHHYRSQKKYQLLDHHQTSPELPFGYPTSIVLSLFPPLWFFIMNPRVPSDMKP
jgi:alkane 1-monooxygenase